MVSQARAKMKPDLPSRVLAAWYQIAISMVKLHKAASAPHPAGDAKGSGKQGFCRFADPQGAAGLRTSKRACPFTARP